MTVAELKKLIKNNDIPHFLIFTGEEWKVQQLYIQQISKVTGLTISYVDAVTDIQLSQSLFSQNSLYIVRDDKEFIMTEKLQKKVLSGIGDNILILELTSADKRLKLLKTYKDSIVEFNELTDAILTQYIQREIDLSDRNCQKLIEICEHNYGRILLEIDKIKKWRELFIKDKEEPIPFDGAFLHLLNDGTIYIPPQDAIFDFVKAVLQNKPKLAFQLYEECKAVGEATMVMLSVLYNNVKQVLQVQVCPQGDVEKTTGLTAWQVRNARECVGKFKASELVYLMRLVQSVERRIKTGEMEEAIAMDYVLVNFL